MAPFLAWGWAPSLLLGPPAGWGKAQLCPEFPSFLAALSFHVDLL